MVAFTREVSPCIQDCLLTHVTRSALNLDLLRQQHQAYEDAIREAGAELKRLAPLPTDPDAVFVEDTAVLCDADAVITRPGAENRRGEIESTVAGLSENFRIHRMDQGTMDGGDVVRIGDTFYVGQSTRTDRDGFDCFASLVKNLGFNAIAVPVYKCLHLITGASYAGVSKEGDRVLVYKPGWIDVSVFKDFKLVAVNDDEAFAANVLMVGDTVIVSAAGPRLGHNLAELGFNVKKVDVSEFHKAEGSLTCMSLVG